MLGPTLTIRALWILALAVGAPSVARAQFFARSDDTRVTAPEQRGLPKEYFFDVVGGADYDQGNVDHLGVHGKASLGIRLTEHNQVYFEEASDHEIFDGKTNLDKDKAAALYVYNLGEHWNVFGESTHARNYFLQLTYRTANSAGLCLHSFAPGFRFILISLAISPENEWWTDGTHDFRLRTRGRINLLRPLSDTVAVGLDLLYAPRVVDPGDFRWYGQTFLEVKLTPDRFALQIVLYDEYDSRPRPGVHHNDVTLLPTLVAHFKE
jgi:hypothetical protein